MEKIIIKTKANKTIVITNNKAEITELGIISYRYDVYDHKVAGFCADLGQHKINGKVQNLIAAISEEDYNILLKYKKDFEKELRMAEKAERELRETLAKKDCPAGYEICTQKWSNGDLCSAEYAAMDGTKVLDSDLLECHYGYYYIENKKIQKAREKRKKELQEKENNKKMKMEQEKEVFAKAKETNEPQLLRKYTCACQDEKEECSLDIVTIYALPNGTTSTESNHTW